MVLARFSALTFPGVFFGESVSITKPQELLHTLTALVVLVQLALCNRLPTARHLLYKQFNVTNIHISMATLTCSWGLLVSVLHVR